MILIAISIMLAYLFLIGSFVYGFDKVKSFKLDDAPAKTKFSVIIPFRNEAEHLPGLLTSIAALKYPKTFFEIILVDDDSDDGSVELIRKYFETKPKAGFDGVYTERSRSTQPDIKIISNERTSNSPKKDAITTAIKHAKHEWIVTTDADCVLPKYWLDSFDQYIQKTNSKCIAAPVIYTKTDSFLNRFQLLDMLSLQGATIGGFGIKKPFLCNGANFTYQKALFFELNGFDGNDAIASGDDIFLLEKIAKKHPSEVHYLKCEHAIVATQPQPDLNRLLSQRIRWAAKTSRYNNGVGKLTGVIVLAANALLIILLLLAIFGNSPLKILLYLIVIKLSIDFLLIYKTSVFFNQKKVLKSYLVAFFAYPFFSVYVVFLSTFKTYTWKGRNFEK